MIFKKKLLLGNFLSCPILFLLLIVLSPITIYPQSHAFEGEITYSIEIEALDNNARDVMACHLLVGDSTRLLIKGDSLKVMDFGSLGDRLIESLYFEKKYVYTIYHSDQTVSKTIYNRGKTYYSENKNKEWYKKLKPTSQDSVLLELPVKKFTSKFKGGLKKEFWYHHIVTSTENSDGLVHRDYGIALMHIDYLENCKIIFKATKIFDYQLDEKLFKLPSDYMHKEFYPNGY